MYSTAPIMFQDKCLFIRSKKEFCDLRFSSSNKFQKNKRVLLSFDTLDGI